MNKSSDDVLFYKKTLLGSVLKNIKFFCFIFLIVLFFTLTSYFVFFDTKEVRTRVIIKNNIVNIFYEKLIANNIDSRSLEELEALLEISPASIKKVFSKRLYDVVLGEVDDAGYIKNINTQNIRADIDIPSYQIDFYYTSKNKNNVAKNLNKHLSKSIKISEQYIFEELSEIFRVYLLRNSVKKILLYKNLLDKSKFLSKLNDKDVKLLFLILTQEKAEIQISKNQVEIYKDISKKINGKNPLSTITSALQNEYKVLESKFSKLNKIFKVNFNRFYSEVKPHKVAIKASDETVRSKIKRMLMIGICLGLAFLVASMMTILRDFFKRKKES